MDFDMDYGMRVSKAGIDVKNAEDKDLIFNSAFNSLKIVSEDSGSASFHTGQRWSHTITGGHGLGYAPSYMMFYKALFYGGNQYWIPDGGGSHSIPIYDPSASTSSGTLLNDDSAVRTYSNSTNVYSEVDNLTGDANNRTYYIKNFVLIEDNA